MQFEWSFLIKMAFRFVKILIKGVGLVRVYCIGSENEQSQSEMQQEKCAMNWSFSWSFISSRYRRFTHWKKG